MRERSFVLVVVVGCKMRATTRPYAATAQYVSGKVGDRHAQLARPVASQADALSEGRSGSADKVSNDKRRCGS